MAHKGGEGGRRSRIVAGRPDPDESVEWEVAHYLAERTDRLIEEGWEPEEARREAERRFGERHRTGMRAMERRRMRMRRMGSWLEFVGEVVGATGRMLRRSPGFALAVIVTLALGIGANAAVFGILDRLLLRPPEHILEPDRVKRLLLQRLPEAEGLQTALTYPDILDWEDSRSFEAVAALSFGQDWTVGRGEDARSVRGRFVTGSFFSLLGAAPVVGRTFAEDDDRMDEPLTAVLGYEFWERAYGTDPDILGRTLEIRGHPATVVGVAPPGFTGVDLEPVDIWLPLEASQGNVLEGTNYRESRGAWWLAGVGRLAEGVTMEAAEEEATRLHRNARQDDIEGGRYDPRIVLTGLVAGEQSRHADAAKVVRWIAAVSILVLLIACANVANLLLARSARQRREVAVRLALGVSRARLVGQRTLETVLLALLGGAGAIVLAGWGGETLQRVLIPEVLFPDGAIGSRVLLFSLGVSLLAGLLAGLMPAVQSTKVDVVGDLKEGQRGSSGRSRLRGLLAAAQAAMSVVLLVGAGLFLRSLHEVRSADLGLAVDEILLATLEFDASDLDRTEADRLYREAMERIARLPGVMGVAATSSPFRWAFAQSLRVPGVDSIPRMPGGGPYYHAVTPGYFDVVGVELLRGRGIAESDGEGAAPVAVVARSMADSLWGAEAAVGQCLLVGRDAETCTTVVGVVEDASRSGPQDAPHFAYYLPLAQSELGARGLYVRSREPAAAAPAVAGLLRTFSPGVRFARVETLRDILDPQARSWRMGAIMFTLFGVLALAVAAVGLYSLLAFTVAERMRELGIRAALGAARRRLLAGVVVQGMGLTVLGLLGGLIAAWLAAPLVADLLFGVSPRDPLVLAGVAATLLAVSLLATLVPGFRATRVDPSEALRAE